MLFGEACYIPGTYQALIKFGYNYTALFFSIQYIFFKKML